jgi:GR25 family glycosyltransferase involved in LPS biosynthesis
MEGGIRIYCINLKHRQDRWERFTSQPELEVLKKSYEFERFEGVNGSSLNILADDRMSLRTKRNIKKHTRRDHEEINTAGGVGCYLSHTGVWKKFLETSEPYAIVFEDDAIIYSGFTADFKQGMKETTFLPQIPDLWFFSKPVEWYYKYRGEPRPDTVSNNVHGPWVSKACSSFTGYFITRHGAQKLLETAFPMDMHVDLYSCLNAEMGNIMAVSNTNISLDQYNSLLLNGTIDSDIRPELETDCHICDIPTQYKERGILMVSIPILFVGLVTISGLWYLGTKRRR